MLFISLAGIHLIPLNLAIFDTFSVNKIFLIPSFLLITSRFNDLKAKFPFVVETLNILFNKPPSIFSGDSNKEPKSHLINNSEIIILY